MCCWYVIALFPRVTYMHTKYVIDRFVPRARGGISYATNTCQARSRRPAVCIFIKDGALRSCGFGCGFLHSRMASCASTTTTLPHGNASQRERFDVRDPALFSQHSRLLSSLRRSASNDTFISQDMTPSLQPLRATRSALPQPPPSTLTSRPLSSADEAGPVPKKPRSLSRQPMEIENRPRTGPSLEARTKKACARPVTLSADNNPSSLSMCPHHVPTSFSLPTVQAAPNARSAKNENSMSNAPTLASRRSIRLLSSGVGEKQKSHVVKVGIHTEKHPPYLLFCSWHVY